MKSVEFEQLIADAGLILLSNWPPRFLVSLHVVTEQGVRIQCDVLAYQPAEFAMLTLERAQGQIEMCKAKLQRAATTQQGRLADERKPQVAKPVQKVVRQQSAVKYPAH